MIKHLYIIRHGEADHLIGGNFTGGWTNSNLTELGRKQAKEVGQRLSSLIKIRDVDFYCSDLGRAKQTADIIGSILSINPIPVMELRELNNGDAANITRSEADKIAFPMTEPSMDWIHYPNAESWRMMNSRVFKFMDSINNGASETVVIVSHRGTIVSIISWWLELNDDYINKISFDIEPGSLTYLRINKWNEKTISRLNETAHLQFRI